MVKNDFLKQIPFEQRSTFLYFVRNFMFKISNMKYKIVVHIRSNKSPVIEYLYSTDYRNFSVCFYTQNNTLSIQFSNFTNGWNFTKHLYLDDRFSKCEKDILEAAETVCNAQY